MQAEDDNDPELQKEVERLQTTLSDPPLHTDRGEQSEKRTREEPHEKLDTVKPLAKSRD